VPEIVKNKVSSWNQ